MNAARYFVVVFGDPNGDRDRDPVESGVYRAGLNYPPFDVLPGDMLLLYCTGEYAEYRMQVPGIGRAVSANSNTIEYDWRALPQPILRETVLQKFEPKYKKMMSQLGMTTRRVFEISKHSFLEVVGDQMPAEALWESRQTT
jgi:hypothetical protein